MGYRSNWKLAFTGKPVDLQKFMEWFEVKTKVRTTDSENNVLYEIFHESDKDIDIRNATIIFSGERWKCYHPWDMVIDNLCTEQAENRFNLEYAYMRIGEATDDIDTQSNGDLCIYSLTTICDPDNFYVVHNDLLEELDEYLSSNVIQDCDRWSQIINERKT